MRWLIGLAVAWGLGGLAQAAEPLFPFVLPWDDASGGVTAFAGPGDRRAGAQGPVKIDKVGHFHVGGERLRFLGVNVCFDACFPSKDDAPKIAGRMARFGINVVRFHHMEMFAWPRGIRDPRGKGTGELHPEALDRLDFFVAELAKHGIYANLNLLVSRPFDLGDGLPAEIEKLGWKERHAAGFFHAPAIKTQKDYARNLLSHRNPYTRKTYAEDPAVAFVEINNENGLIHAWMGQDVDALPTDILKDLQEQWNRWLKSKHGTTEKLRRAWAVKNVEPGQELLSNANFARGADRWTLERHDRAEAKATASDELPAQLKAPAQSLRIDVTQPGAMTWHVQLNQGGLKIEADKPYTLTLWARADQPLNVTAAVGQAHDPWKNLGLQRDIKLTTQWQPFRFVFLPSAADDNARVGLTNLARQKGTVWLAGVSFRQGGTIGLGADERLEAGTVRRCERDRFGEYTAEGQRDWLRFLWETEDAYWQTMNKHVKDELKVQGVVMGTIVGCSTPNLMARLDAVDTHAYWQHPRFPGRPWDPENWIVQNRSMVNEAGGTLPGLALRRVQGRPHCVTEYNHAAPNTYSAEALPLLAAYAALQDWDAIYAFAYSHNSDWNARRISSFFDINQHPTKMATLPVASALFVRGDIKPAREVVTVALGKDREIDALRSAHAWDLVHAGSVGVPREAALMHRVALAVEGTKATSSKKATLPGQPRYVSDTEELTWDLTQKDRGVVTIDTTRSKAVIGFGGGKKFDLSGVRIEPGQTQQDGWGMWTLTVTEGDLKGPGRLLLTATGTAENTGQKWKSEARQSVGRDWGKAPSLVEGVPAQITLPMAADRVRAWALDERGQRRDELTLERGEGDRTTLVLGPKHKTLWYEVELKGR